MKKASALNHLFGRSKVTSSPPGLPLAESVPKRYAVVKYI